MSRIFITGDIHGYIGIDRLEEKNFPQSKELTKDDYLIICGDFGLVFAPAQTTKEKYWLDWLESQPYTTLFIDGNHENFLRLDSHPVEEWHGGKIHKINSSVFHLMRGQIYEIGGYKWFTFGGAESPDRAYREQYKDWWPQETPSIEDYNEGIKNLRENDFKVDFILTHAMPQEYIEDLFYNPRTKPNGTPYLLQDFKRLCEYRDWYCGHYHIDCNLRENFHMLFSRIVEVI